MRRAAAGVMFHDVQLRTLLVKPKDKPYWDLPGGVVEPNEPPLDAATREVKEELGLVVQVGRLLVVDYFPATSYISEATMYVFDGGRLPDAEITLQADELVDWGWFRPTEIADRTDHAPILQARIMSARMSLRMDATYYCESGHIKA